ncbi:TetR/AcrR family transcriptional regulator [Streptoalloteichus hindustanus]|uniref:Transcriptional regulator, TetR family n=1 Tax=Streptoalloteichus hindustanus TaxID=2017 RepID=A0A1M5I315_STRHI|nr:TetR/AcrR family transcriptional regulator [Streptoalloteichus hindustanus]SHG22694.1 transcriptional regulator, TetR family [Streptoalloteichus hindustanus]
MERPRPGVRGRGAAHDERRSAILDAVFTIVDTEGAEQVSIRRVAERARVSVGRVQHYFPTKDDLLTAAFTAVNDLGASRVHENLRTADNADDPATVLHAMLSELIPATDDDRRLFRVMQAFETHALTRPHLNDRIKRRYEELAGLVALLLHRNAGTRPDSTASASLSRAHELLALTIGLAGLTLTGSITPQQAQHIARTRLDAVLAEASGR